MTTDHDSPTMRGLRDLDAADGELSQPQRRRATATLERILATDPATPAPFVTPVRTPHRRPRYLVLAAGVVAAVTAAVVLGPSVTRDTEAFASWSATPVELAGAERTAALEACLSLLGDNGGELALDPGADSSVLVAEARGGWSYVLFTTPSVSGRTLQGSCLMPEELVAEPRPGEGGFFGSLGGAEETAGPSPAATVARQDSSGAGSIEGELFVYAEGRAGVDVVAIEVTTPGGLQVDASVENGRWAAWWPAGDDSPRNPEISEAPTYEVTLRDGTVTDGVRTDR